MIRAFVGFFTTKRLQEQVEKLEKQTEHFLRGKWVEPQNLHMTFQFLGDVEEGKLIDIVKNIQEIAQRYKPVKVKYKSLGVFPSLERARVLWIGVSDGANNLKNLAKEITKANKRSGIKEEGKPFHPHVTVCRIKDFDRRKLKDLLKQYESTNFGEDTVDRIALVKSSLSSVGPVYTILEEFYFHG
ncbi:MAG: RNA 2',3'-cyclic phosphodiesterase [Hydrogenobacter sp.]|uniref:RNA 2',3'-cyclic phosphodiesterase n=1 Tax=Hydrogenobacter thermophilus TaxID=940 RepID=UPI0030F978DB